MGKERDLEERWPARIIHLYDGTLWPATPRAQASTFFPTAELYTPSPHNSSAGRRGGGREQGLGLELCGCTTPPPAQQLIRHAELCNHRTLGAALGTRDSVEMLIPGRPSKKENKSVWRRRQTMARIPDSLQTSLWFPHWPPCRLST